MSLGMPEIIVLLVIALLLFGPSRLPGLGKSLGEAIRGFKKGIDGAVDKDVTDASERIEGTKDESLVKDKDRVKNEEHS